MSNKYKCVIFDIDGTILNTERMNFIPLQRLIKEETGQDVPYESLLKYKAYQGLRTIEELGFKDIEGIYKKWVKYVNEFEEDAKLFDGFDKLIKTLDENGIICAIASSKMKKQYEIDFHKTGLHKYMRAVVLAEDTEKHKPYPEPLLKAAEIVGVSPKDCIYVGDTSFDYKATKAAGMKFALALWGASDLNGIDADYNLNHPLDLLKVLGI